MRVLADDIVFPNGLVIPDGTLFVAETYRTRITRVAATDRTWDRVTPRNAFSKPLRRR